MSPQCCFFIFCCSFLNNRAAPISSSAGSSHLASNDDKDGKPSSDSSPLSVANSIHHIATVKTKGKSVLLTTFNVSVGALQQSNALKKSLNHSTNIFTPKHRRQGRTLAQLTPVTTPFNASEVEKSQRWYHTAGWLPQKGLHPERSVNLTVLPMLAFAFFLFGVCIKCFSWMREHDRTKDRGQLDFEDADELNYTIITAGEHGEVDLRSDTTSMYDTVTSFRSFRLPFNEQHTVTSIKSLPNQPFETYRSIVLQKANEGVYDSVQSYKAFLEKAIKMKDDVDIEVELVDDYRPRPRSKSYSGSEAASNRSRKRRLRHHSAGKGIEGGAKTEAEKERCRRHSGNSVPHPAHPPAMEPLRGKSLYRRSSPVILEPLEQEGDSRSSTGQSDNEDADVPLPPGSHPLFTLDHQESNSSSSSGGSSMGSSHKRQVQDTTATALTHKRRRERLRQKRASQDKLSEEQTGKGAINHFHHRHCSYDSPRSSSPSDSGNSNGADSESESEVTDSGLVVDLPQADLSPSPKLVEFRFMSFPELVELPKRHVEQPRRMTKQSCFRNKGDGNGQKVSAEVGEMEGSEAAATRKVARFKVSFVDDATLSPTTSEGE